jgi:peptidoglycan/LPS O-acetylase OafA/YrhL
MSKSFRLDIQGLRAIAVLVVLVFHINNDWLPGGFVGVDIFFVISGHLITSLILKQKQTKQFSFINFYASRVRRIVPAYYVLIFAVILSVAYAYIPTDIDTIDSGLKNAIVFNSNNYFKQLNTYFGATASENPLLHTWTLAVEMQFYLFLPFLIVAFSQKWAKYIVLTIGAALLAYSQYQIGLGDKEAMYFSLLARTPEFFIGALIPLFNIRNSNKDVLSITGLLLILVALIYTNERRPFPGLLALLPCVGAALVLIAGDSRINLKYLSARPIMYLGEISYSVYLWHWPVLAFIRYKTQHYELSWLMLLVAITSISVLSLCSYCLVEHPLRAASNKKLAITGLIGLFTILASVYALKYISIYKNRNWYSEHLTTPKSIGLTSHANNYQDTIRGDNFGKDTVLIIGDSHGLVMTYYMDVFGKQYNYAVRSVTNDSYPPIRGLKVNKRSEAQYQRLCSIADSLVKKSRIIVFTKKWRFDIPNFEAAFTHFANGLDRSKKLIVVTDFPELDANPVRKANGVTSDSKFEYVSKTSAMPSFVAKLKNVSIADLSCNVPVYIDDSVAYYDSGHLNIKGINHYERNTAEKMKKVIEQKTY